MKKAYPRYSRRRHSRRKRQHYVAPVQLRPANSLFADMAEAFAYSVEFLAKLLVKSFRLIMRKPPTRQTPIPIPPPLPVHRWVKPPPLSWKRPSTQPAADQVTSQHTAHRSMPYRRSRHLLTKGERAFWYPLYKSVKGKYRIFCKVRLADLVEPPDNREKELWFRKISGYHVDFVICSPQTTTPLLVIELDDCSHRSLKQQKRDQFKEDVLASAKLPLFRVEVQEAYDPAMLKEEILARIRSG